jgi:DNA-binding transcriptional regulator YdaS (Cro superfamily)
MKKNTRRITLEKAFGETDIRELADRLKTSRSVVYNIKYGLRQVSALRAIEIEKASEGKISRAVLRPDIFGS